jgi:hypothetical protein
VRAFPCCCVYAPMLTARCPQDPRHVRDHRRAHPRDLVRPPRRRHARRARRLSPRRVPEQRLPCCCTLVRIHLLRANIECSSPVAGRGGNIARRHRCRTWIGGKSSRRYVRGASHTPAAKPPPAPGPQAPPVAHDALSTPSYGSRRAHHTPTITACRHGLPRASTCRGRRGVVQGSWASSVPSRLHDRSQHTPMRRRAGGRQPARQTRFRTPARGGHAVRAVRARSLT